MARVVEGQRAQNLDIYLRFNNILADPLSITYRIAEPSGSLVASGASPFKRSVGIYDARTTIIPSGFSLTGVWLITWTFVSPDNVNSSAIQEFTVVASAPIDVADLITQLRLDLDITTSDYTDAELQIFIEKALNRLNRKLKFTGTSAELSFSSSTGTITPTPNSTIFDLIVLQVECIIVKTRRAESVKKGIKVRDGDSSIDTTAGFGGHGDMVRDACQEVDEAIKKYLRDQGDAAVHGQMMQYGDQEILIDHSHDGQTDFERDFTSPFDEDF
jgi:hypothetical protein